ncbi:transposase [Nitrosomonas communis]|uniref:Transposase n=1 Tax=Nitrosomonas communis TaxID=44574 RepID=A0A5D3YEK6_9PROT|nr:transposase [Nitrosomonas communis]
MHQQSGFILLFEALALAMIERKMPVDRVAELMQVDPQRIWPIFNHWVGKALHADNPAAVSQLGVDKTSTRKGRNYITVGVDRESERVVYVNERKGRQAVQAIGRHLQAKGAQAEQIQQVSVDLSPAFIAGVKATFPDAQITFDRFHIVKLLNQAMDAVRKTERKEHDALKGHQYIFLRNPESLSETQQQQLTSSFASILP